MAGILGKKLGSLRKAADAKSIISALGDRDAVGGGGVKKGVSMLNIVKKLSEKRKGVKK